MLGIEHGNEVIVPTLTFIEAVNPVWYLGEEPVYMYCYESLNMDMDMDKLEMFLESECKFINGQVINRRTIR